MIKHASQLAVAEDQTMPVAPAPAIDDDEHIAPAPRVSIQAFCETVETAAAVQAASFKGSSLAIASRILRSA